MTPEQKQLDELASKFTSEVFASFKRHADRPIAGVTLVAKGGALIAALHATGDILMRATVELMPPEEALRIEAHVEEARQAMVSHYARIGSDA